MHALKIVGHVRVQWVIQKPKITVCTKRKRCQSLQSVESGQLEDQDLFYSLELPLSGSDQQRLDNTISVLTYKVFG